MIMKAFIAVSLVIIVGVYSVVLSPHTPHGFTGAWTRDENGASLNISSSKAVSSYGPNIFTSSGTIEMENDTSARISLSVPMFGTQTFPVRLNGDNLLMQDVGGGGTFVYHRCTENCPPVS